MAKQAAKHSADQRALLSSRVSNEMRELHARSQSCAEQARGRSGRRELREAQQAEADLLRFLGFDTYDAFEAAASAQGLTASDGASVDARDAVVTRDGIVDELRARVGHLEEELAEAAYEIQRMRETLAAGPSAVRTDGLADARAALFEACAQLTALYDGVLDKNAVAEVILEEARENARQITGAAREQASMMIREAEVTIAGLREIAETELRHRRD